MKKINILLIIAILSLLQAPLSAVDVSLLYDKNSGVAPLQVNFRVEVTAPAIYIYEWDLDGDGAYETSNTESTAVYTYNTVGIYYPKVQVYSGTNYVGADTTEIFALQQTINNLSGTISGYANLIPGEYFITSDVVIDTGAVLVIGAGSELKFSSSAHFNVKGALYAIGESNNFIRFTSLETGDWEGILFDTSSIGFLSNSILENAKHGIKAAPSSVIIISSSEIRNCGLMTENGGGILLSDNSQVNILESNLYYNKANYGGAAYNDNGTLFLDSCSLAYNSANDGLGIYNTGSSANIYALYNNFIFDTGAVNNDYFVNNSPNDLNVVYYNWWSTIDNSIINNCIYDSSDSFGTCGVVFYNYPFPKSNTKYTQRNFPPAVNITSNHDTGGFPLTINFTANAVDYDGSITLYEWDFDGNGTYDLTNNNVNTAIYIYGSSGTYHPKVRVTDNNGSKVSDSKIITVTSLNLNLDTTVPKIEGTDLFGLLNNGEDSYVTVTVSDNIALTKGEFFVKKNGEGENAFVPIYTEGGLSILKLTKSIKIPKEYITPRGISYKIIATDWADNKKEVVGNLSVKVAGYTVPFPTWTWKMVSFPLVLDSSNIDYALSLSEDRRVYRWNTAKKEYSNNYDTTFDPGDAFWLKIKGDNIPDTLPLKVNGASVDPDKVSAISLSPGWTQIADPFAYQIASSKIKVKQDTVEIYVTDTSNIWLENQFLTYDYDTTNAKRSYLDLTTISPDIGFWVKNRSDKDITIVFPKYDANATGLMTVNSPSRKVKNDGWGLKLKVMSKNYIDNENYLGFLPGAKNGYDFNDLSEPPPVESYVSLYFPHSDWGKDNGRYRTDYRACGNFGALEITNFDFVIETNVKDKTTLSWDVINPPLNFRVILYDKKEDKKIDMAGIKDYAIDWQDGDSKRDFSIIVEWDNIYFLNSIEISDLNLNHIIDGEDLSIFGSSFGKTQGESTWNPKADLNKDKIIDGSDLYILGNSFGKSY
ncbi:MAG: PKD domain-containing protein [bacterium]|nr:PKD domain-containing protein [bacterium]